jgi:hypothetical protein
MDEDSDSPSDSDPDEDIPAVEKFGVSLEWKTKGGMMICKFELAVCGGSCD